MNKNYDILLFDLDNTLLDFTASEAIALPQVFRQFGHEMTEEVYAVYRRENHKLWDDFEHNLIQMEEISEKRFANTMKNFSVEVDGCQWDEQYRRNICEAGCLMDGVKEIVPILAKTHRLFIATNGFTNTQMNRLEHAGILKYFEGVFTSQEMRCQKPNIEFFQYIEKNIPNYEREKTLMIGDSLQNDIEGANQAGIDSCYIHAVNGNLESPIYRKYEIASLKELLDIV